MPPRTADQSQDDIDVVQARVALRQSAQAKLVERWLTASTGSPTSPAEADEQLGSGKQDVVNDTEESLAALARSQRAGLGKLDVGTTQGSSSKAKAADEDLLTLRRQLKLNKSSNHKSNRHAQGLKRGWDRSAGSEDSDEEGRSQIVWKRDFTHHPEQTHTDVPESYPEHNASMLSTTLSSHPVSKRKPVSFLDEMLEQKQSKRAKANKKKSKVSEEVTNEVDARPFVNAGRDFALDKGLSHGNNFDPNLINEAPVLNNVPLRPTEPSEASGEADAHVDAQILTPEHPMQFETAEETEAEKRKRRNKDKKMKFKQKQHQRKVEKLDTG